MVCDRCIASVKSILDDLKIPYTSVTLGHAYINQKISQTNQLNKELEKVGFSLISNKNHILTEKIKNSIVNYIHYSENKALKINFSHYISRNLGYNYAHLSYVFSETEGITIEHYLILQKLEKVKELIAYGELNFTDIAAKLNYSSLSHLSRQFKKWNGISLSTYRKKYAHKRNALDNIH